MTNSQTDTDPGIGNLKWSSVGQANAAELYVDDQDKNSVDYSSLYTTLKDSDVIRVQRQEDPNQFQIFKINNVVDRTGWFRLEVSPIVDGGSSFSLNDNLILIFEISGPQGQTGADIQGVTGVQGIQGLTGAQGETGAGIQGETGVVGVQGQTGALGGGETGVAGVQGETGVAGVAGETGAGIQGDTGVQGIRGETGIQGETGAGIQGETGVQGVAGETGIQGIGETGVQGVTEIGRASCRERV